MMNIIFGKNVTNIYFAQFCFWVMVCTSQKKKLDPTHQEKEDRELDPQVQALSLSVDIFVIGQFDCHLMVRIGQFV